LAGETIDLDFTSIRKIENENPLKITKAGNQLYVISGQSQVSGIRIFNSLGQNLIAKKGTITSVDISGLPAGIYIAEATSADNRQKI
jgi:hypothetical protein